MGGNVHYTSERIVQEVVGILADQIENAQISAMSNSLHYGLMRVLTYQLQSSWYYMVNT